MRIRRAAAPLVDQQSDLEREPLWLWKPFQHLIEVWSKEVGQGSERKCRLSLDRVRSENEITASVGEFERGVPECGLADPDPAFDDAGPRPASSGPR
jgi:hypothetical protein